MKNLEVLQALEESNKLIVELVDYYERTSIVDSVRDAVLKRAFKNQEVIEMSKKQGNHEKHYLETLRERFFHAMESGRINKEDPTSYLSWFNHQYTEVMVSNLGWATSHKDLTDRLSCYNHIESVLEERAKKYEVKP